jgi:hypothetical protein
VLQRSVGRTGYVHITTIDTRVAGVFMILFIALAAFKVT